MTAPNVKVLIGEVAKRHGITLKPDDPAFALVTLNQLILEHAIDTLNEQTRNATREFAESLSRLQIQTGNILGTQVRNAASQLRQAFEQGGNSVSGGVQSSEQRTLVMGGRRLAAGVIAGLALFVLGILIGHFGK